MIKESLQICTGHSAVCGKSLISAGLSFHQSFLLLGDDHRKYTKNLSDLFRW